MSSTDLKRRDGTLIQTSRQVIVKCSEDMWDDLREFDERMYLREDGFRVMMFYGEVGRSEVLTFWSKWDEQCAHHL
jgi:hypothetical protein